MNYSVSTDQLNFEIEDKDVTFLAGYFDNVEYYLDTLELTPCEQEDVKNKVPNGNQLAMNHCLFVWKKRYLSKATLGSLLEILLKLGKEKIASDVCAYYFPKPK